MAGYLLSCISGVPSLKQWSWHLRQISPWMLPVLSFPVCMPVVIFQHHLLSCTLCQFDPEVARWWQLASRANKMIFLSKRLQLRTLMTNSYHFRVDSKSCFHPLQWTRGQWFYIFFVGALLSSSFIVSRIHGSRIYLAVHVRKNRQHNIQKRNKDNTSTRFEIWILIHVIDYMRTTLRP